MSNLLPQFSLNSLNVYEGVWKKYNEAALRRWIWTLKDSKALLVLASLTTLVAFTQTRAWVIIRYVIALRKGPVRLPDNNNPEPLRTPSQGRAIAEALSPILDGISMLQIFVRRAFQTGTRHQDPPANLDCSVVSLWFGIFAILNIGLFVAMGVAIPWFLSDGALEMPIVRSRMIGTCANYTTIFGSSLNGIITPHLYTDAIFRQCTDQLNQGCENRYYLQQPQIHKTRPEACPFPGNICHNLR